MDTNKVSNLFKNFYSSLGYVYCVTAYFNAFVDKLLIKNSNQ